MNKIVCAACLTENGFMAVGVRHWDSVMQEQMRVAFGDDHKFWPKPTGDNDEGFIDVKGNYLTREEAAKVAVDNGQLTIDDIRGWPQLHSDDLY